MTTPAWYLPGDANGRAQWHHLMNTIELVLLSAHPSPQPKLANPVFNYV